MQMYALRSEGSIEGDHFEVSFQHGGLGLAGALKRGLGEVADHAENKAADSVPLGQFFEAEAQITAGSKLQRQGTHGASKGCSRLRNLVLHDIVSILILYFHETVSLLQDLVHELQQRIEGQAAAPSTAAVADAAGSERINVTLPRGVMDDLKRHALAEGRSCGNLAAYLLEEALRRHRPLG